MYLEVAQTFPFALSVRFSFPGRRWSGIDERFSGVPEKTNKNKNQSYARSFMVVCAGFQKLHMGTISLEPLAKLYWHFSHFSTWLQGLVQEALWRERAPSKAMWRSPGDWVWGRDILPFNTFKAWRCLLYQKRVTSHFPNLFTKFLTTFYFGCWHHVLSQP